ncbi:hypothetical protein [Flavobacterium sp.]|jgi:uncharacterized membrane protein|uniref:hypothetical protein n=1 Tax=Flavobacterium sp. TaxID=239 RepID=UPI0037C16BF6
MNDAHLHLVVNHFPIIGTIFGLGILIAGLIFKNQTLKNTAFVLFIIAAAFGFASMNTGEGAEEIAEKLPGVTDQLIETHEELAETFSLFLYATGLMSLISLFLAYKKSAIAKFTTLATVGVAIVAVFFAQQTGTSGGEIRHTEIRANATTPSEGAINKENDLNADDH